MPFRLIISGSLVIGFVTGLMAYNSFGMNGIWGLAIIIWSLVFFLLYKRIKPPTPPPKK